MAASSIFFDRTTREFVGLTYEIKQELLRVYKEIDLDAELMKMKIWLESSKGKQHKGTIQFISNWLNNSSANARWINRDTLQELDASITNLLNDYLNDLWKNKTHILELNRRKR